MTSEIQNTHLNTISAVAKTEHLPEKKDEAGLLTINGTLIVIIVSFVLFALLMQTVFYGPLSKIKSKRSEHINNAKKEAEESALQAEILGREYHESLMNTRKKVKEKTTEALNEANEEKSKILEEKKQQISDYLKQEKEYIQSEKNETMDVLKSQIADYAYNISRKILGEEIPMAGITQEVIEEAIQNSNR